MIRSDKQYLIKSTNKTTVLIKIIMCGKILENTYIMIFYEDFKDLTFKAKFSTIPLRVICVKVTT